MNEGNTLYIKNRGKENMVKRWKVIKPYLTKKGNVLDIGCNTGYYSIKANELGNKVIGIDIDEKCIETGKKYNKDYSTNVDFRNLKKDEIIPFLKEFKDNQFDYIFYLSVHHHIFEQGGIKLAREVLKELSRIGKIMFFDMGQSNEKDNGYLTWKKKVPIMFNPEKGIISHVLLSSRFIYGEIISSTTIHEVERILFIFLKEPPKELSIKELIINKKKYIVDSYVWKDKGSKGSIHESNKGFPLFGYYMDTRSKYYLVHDKTDKKFFIKERFYVPYQDYLKYNRLEYYRGQKIRHIPNTLPAIDIDERFLVFEYFTLNHIGSLVKQLTEIDLNTRKEMFKTIVEINKILEGFDFNLNNILYKDGEFKIIDFEPAVSSFSTWEKRLKDFKNVLEV